MEHRPDNRNAHDPIAMVANIAGISSFILAVAGNNVDKLSHLQKLGLASASTLMVWTFMAGILARYIAQHVRQYQYGYGLGAIFFGSMIGAGLLLAAVPLFSFGLPAPEIEDISIIAAGAFVGVFTLGALLGAFARN